MVYYNATQLALAYDSIKRQALNGHCTVAIFVASDADALCACRILVNLLTSDFISHKVVPVAGYTDLEEAGRELIQEHEELKSIIMLNCGALVDLTEMFPLRETHTIYVCDTHRPIHLRNLFGSAQVVVLDDGEAEASLQLEREAYEEIGFGLSNSEDDDDGDSDDDRDSMTNGQLNNERIIQDDDDDDDDDENEDDDVDIDESDSALHSDTIENTHEQDSNDLNDDTPHDNGSIYDKDQNETSSINGTLVTNIGNGRKRSSQDNLFDMNVDDRPSRRQRVHSDDETEKKVLQPSRRSKRKQYRALMVDYYSRGSYHGSACASQMYDLANQLSRATRESLWLAIIGATSLFVHDQCEPLRFETAMTVMRDEVAHFQAKEQEDETPLKRPMNETAEEAKKRFEQITAERRAVAADRDQIQYIKELMLYRHWSFYDALYHSRYVATSLGIWSERGRTKLLNLLAKIGLSKRQANELHSELDPTLRRKMRHHLKEVAALYRLEKLQFPSFVRVVGYSGCISASDAVYSLTALLKSDRATVSRLIDADESNRMISGRDLSVLFSANHKKPGNFMVHQRGNENNSEAMDDEAKTDKTWLQNFWVAYDALGRAELLNTGINLAKAMRRAIVRQAVTIIEKRAIRTLNNFRFTVLRDGPDLPIFAHSLTASQLALFLLDAMRATSKKRLPFVLATFCELQDVFLVVGLADNAQADHSPIKQNPFGIAFHRCADEIRAQVRHDGFDTSVLEISKDDLEEFLERLHLFLPMVPT